MEEKNAPFVYLGSQFFSKNPSPHAAALQARLKAAYPETEFMALETGPNPNLLPKGGFRIRFHSVGGYGTIATGKLLTDILAGVLGLHSKAAPKYGSEKSGAPTNYYITLSPEPVLLTNADLEDVEIVVSPDHKVFAHSNPLRGLVAGGTFMLQSSLPPLEVWKELPAQARKTIRDKKINFFVLDGFAVAKRHAPRPELETRMMGIAFIGAICGHCTEVTAGADAATVLEKIRHDLTKKFGAKGGAIVEGNMSVIQDAVGATQRVAYEQPEFALAETAVAARANGRSVALSANFCRADSTAATSGFLDAEYFDDIYAAAFREGAIAEAPVMPGTGMFLPAGSAAGKDKGLFRLKAPEFHPDLCTGCMECAIACPDAAIPNTVHDISDLVVAAIRQLDIAETQREALRALAHPIADAAREIYRGDKSAKSFHEVVGQAIDGLSVDSAVVRGNLKKLAAALVAFPVARTRPFFDAAETAKPGSGGLFSAVIDPWKCTGCLECVDVCGPHALVEREQDAEFTELMQTRFEFLTRTPNTPARFVDGAIGPDGDAKRLMLDRHNYYATTGGHGACRGCGEVTAIRLVTSTNHAIHDKRRREQIREVEDLIDKLGAKAKSVADTIDDPQRSQRIAKTLASLEKALYLLESGPRGDGPASAVISNATGCSSVYASTFPFNPYTDPWVNSLFQDFSGGRQRRVRRPRRRGGRASAGAAHRQARARRRLRSANPRQEVPHPELERIHAGRTGDAADSAEHRRRRRDLRHRLWRIVAPAVDHHPDQGRRAQHRRLLQHRRPGLDGQPHRPGLRPRPLRRGPFGQAGAAQGAGVDRRVPPERLRGAELRLAAWPLPQERGRDAQLQRIAGGARRLHALPGRTGHHRPAGQPSRASGGPKPDEPGVRPRSAPRRAICTAGSRSTATPPSTRIGRPPCSNTSRTARPS